MLPTLKQFINGPRPNAYVRFPGFLSMYVRTSRRFGFHTLDLANIEATTPGRGAFTCLVRHLRKRYPDMGIYVECVLNDRFVGKLEAMGFTRCDSGLSICFFLSPSAAYGDPMTQQDKDAEQYISQALNLLNKTVSVIRVSHPYAPELLAVIDKLEKSEYLKWLAKARHEETTR